MSEPSTEMAFMVVMTVPARLTATEVGAELATCISFGKPRICLIPGREKAGDAAGMLPFAA